MKTLSKIILVLVLLTNNALGEIVKKIDILGNNRIPDETIMMFSDINLNDNVDNNKLNLTEK